MTRKISFIILIIILFSCENKEQSKIKGNWHFVREYNIPYFDKDGYELPPIPPTQNLGFNFYSGDSCEANQSFYDSKSFNVDYYMVELGRKTIYEIKDDSLKVFDRTLEKWQSYHIIYLDDNNLTLNNNNRVIKSFTKKLK